MTLAARDEPFLARCLELAERARGRTAPNPIVGCVIVRGGKVIAEGHHRGPGTPHAEADALAQLAQRGGRARGATLYCNLEPCNHHGRTPPCAPMIREAGVARVVIGGLDPIAGHGGGAKLLRAARIAVDVATGALAEACARANAPFFTWATLGRPRLVLKAAITLDGKIATVGGDARWITGAAARADGHRLRDQHDAIVVGIGTVLADDPQLTARGQRTYRDPIRVVVDSRLRTPPTAQLLPRGQARAARTIIACTPRAPVARERKLVAAGAEVWRVAAARDGRVALPALATRLGTAGITAALVEGGGALHASLLAAELADELYLYIAPKVVGGPAPSWVGGDGVRSLARAYGFSWDGPPVRLGDDLRLHAITVR